MKKLKKTALEHIGKNHSLETLKQEEIQPKGDRITADYGDGTCLVTDSDFYRAVKASDIQQVRALILASQDR